jgi:7-cyano-7-deazaguanine synthase in queuosine biosynthesis
MAHPAITDRPPALTAGQAVALTLLRDGYTERTITTRTDVTPHDLYRLAALHGITAECGTVEGHACHQARGEDPCGRCERARGRADARALARQRKSTAALHARQAGRRPAARGVTA